MRLNNQTEYGLRSLIYIAENYTDKPITARQLTENEQVPFSFAEKILLKMKNSGILKSIKGTHGGYILDKKPSQIFMYDVLFSLEEDIFSLFCDESLKEKVSCNHHSDCLLGDFWKGLKEKIENYCRSISLEMIIKDPNKLQLISIEKEII